MTENKTHMPAGIDETAIFKRLWSKKVFILIVTGISLAVGIVSISHYSPIYSVHLPIIFKAESSEPMVNLFQYGEMDFSRYAQTGKIERQDSLHFSKDEQALLEQFKNRINFTADISKHCVIISGGTIDTLEFIKELTSVGKFVEKKMSMLFEKYRRQEIDSLHVRQNKIQTILENDLKELMELQEKHPGAQDFDTRMKIKLAEYEYASSSSHLFVELERLKQSEKQLRKMDISLSSPQAELVEIQQDKRSLLMRWLFFGFAGSCIWVLGSHHISVLIKKRKN